MKKMIISAVTILIIIFVIAMAIPASRWVLLSVLSSKPVCRECGRSHVIHDYYAATGISRNTLGATPAEVVEIYGKPDYVAEEDKGEGRLCEMYHYKDFAIIFAARDPVTESAKDCEAVGFIIYSPDIEIRHDIHVGSTREEIIHAYRKCPSIVYPETDGDEIGDWLYDNGLRNWWENTLVFTYDENDIVTSISYYPWI